MKTMFTSNQNTENSKSERFVFLQHVCLRSECGSGFRNGCRGKKKEKKEISEMKLLKVVL